MTHFEVIQSSSGRGDDNSEKTWKDKSNNRSAARAKHDRYDSESGNRRSHPARKSANLGRDFTIVRVQLETGRRNQIRVHFAEAGHPVLGDLRYPRVLRETAAADDPVTSAHPKWNAKRLALHAASLEFMHPVTGKKMRFEAEVPAEFAWFMQPPEAPRKSGSTCG